MTTLTKTNIHEQIQEQLVEARELCDIKGVNSAECAAAFDALEELQAEASHQREVKPETFFEKYCKDHPEADECRIYDD